MNDKAAPKNLRIFRDDAGLRIRYAWINIYTIQFFVAALAWDCFLLWFFIVQVAGSRNHTFQPVLIALGATGVLMTYVALVHAINKTEIIANRNDIVAKIGPFPWRGSTSFKVYNILKLEAGRGPGRLMPRWSANVTVSDRNGGKKMLISNLARADQAEHIISTISGFLQK